MRFFRDSYFFLVAFTAFLAVKCHAYSFHSRSFFRMTHQNGNTKIVQGDRSIKAMLSFTTAISIFSTSSCLYSMPALAKTELPAIEKCFDAVRKEISPEGESIKRLRNDIESASWDDIVTFTREYDAGFRGGVLKSVWKQLDGSKKDLGISLSNSFTFDLIALNKAARTKDAEEATKRLEQVRQDLVDFLQLESNTPAVDSAKD